MSTGIDCDIVMSHSSVAWDINFLKYGYAVGTW